MTVQELQTIAERVLTQIDNGDLPKDSEIATVAAAVIGFIEGGSREQVASALVTMNS